MCPTITVDEEVYDQLKRIAEPFVDTPNDVLRRVFHLGAHGAVGAAADVDGALSTDYEGEEVTEQWVEHDRRGRPVFVFRSVSRTPDREFRTPILRALEEKGGRAPTVDVLERVEQIMQPILKPIDYKPMQSGQIRWKSAANFERKHMALERVPLINPGSPRGIWEITEAGRRYLRETSEE